MIGTSYFTTTYDGEDVDTTVRELDEADANVYCPNDECPSIEVIHDGDEVLEVIRVAWNSGPVAATGPSYACGGEPGYDRYPECPKCGTGSRDLP